jgi:hypothetical protein
MSKYRIVLILDDAVPAQATLLGQINADLASIAGNLVPANAPSTNSIEVQKLS